MPLFLSKRNFANIWKRESPRAGPQRSSVNAACSFRSAREGRRRMTELLLQPTGNPSQSEVIADEQIVGGIALFSALRDRTNADLESFTRTRAAILF
jgi:hypothetical protein